MGSMGASKKPELIGEGPGQWYTGLSFDCSLFPLVRGNSGGRGSSLTAFGCTGRGSRSRVQSGEALGRAEVPSP